MEEKKVLFPEGEVIIPSEGQKILYKGKYSAPPKNLTCKVADNLKPFLNSIITSYVDLYAALKGYWLRHIGYELVREIPNTDLNYFRYEKKYRENDGSNITAYLSIYEYSTKKMLEDEQREYIAGFDTRLYKIYKNGEKTLLERTIFSINDLACNHILSIICNFDTREGIIPVNETSSLWIKRKGRGNIEFKLMNSNNDIETELEIDELQTNCLKTSIDYFLKIGKMRPFKMKGLDAGTTERNKNCIFINDHFIFMDIKTALKIRYFLA